MKVLLVLGKVFFEKSNKVTALVFPEKANDESLMNEEHEIYQSIKILSKYLLHLAWITQSFIKESLDDIHGVKQRKMNGYKLLKRTRSKMFKLNPISEELRFFSSWNQIIFKSSPPEVFLGKVVLKICSKFTGEYPCQSVISIKLQIKFIEITLRYGCCLLNLLHISRTPFPMNTCGGLFLDAAVNGKNKVQRLCVFIVH